MYATSQIRDTSTCNPIPSSLFVAYTYVSTAVHIIMRDLPELEWRADNTYKHCKYFLVNSRIVRYALQRNLLLIS